MSIVVPAILPKSRNELDAALARFAAVPEIKAVQIDVVDGRFASPSSWPYRASEEFAEMVARGESLPLFERFRYDIDLMVMDPEEAIGVWVNAGAARLTVHLESTTYLPRVITDMRDKYGQDPAFTPNLLSFGLAINIDTDLALLEPYLGAIDYVQCMGIAVIGKQGQPFDTRVLSKIHALRKLHPDIDIQVDGGVTLETAPDLLEAGVDRLVVGHDLVNAPDVAAQFAAFEALGEKYGVYER